MSGKKTAYILIAFGVIIIVILSILYLTKTSELNSNYPIDINIFSSYGAIVGGILGALFSLAGVFLLISTLESQQANFDQQLFESKFFDLVKIHRENSKEINAIGKEGRDGFVSLKKEFIECEGFVGAVNEEMTPNWKLKEEEIINISYLCFFYGAGDGFSKPIITKKLTAYKTYLNSIFENFRKNVRSRKKDFPYTPFTGHQSILGHYFRHLFQVITFVDKQPKELLNYRKKYDYVKILRAQLSTEEQILLFYNSLSDLGKLWEKLEGLEENKKLITKYNLIKNIPIGYTESVELKKYYPDITFEGDIVSDERKKLEKNYS